MLSLFLPMNIVFLLAWWDSTDQKVSQPGEPITGCSMAQQSQVGVLLLLDHTWVISSAAQKSCLSERQAGITQLHFQKEANTALLEKSQNCYMFDSRAPKVFRCFLPHGNLCRIHFVDEALCVLCGRLCRYRLIKYIPPHFRESWGSYRCLASTAQPTGMCW